MSERQEIVASGLVYSQLAKESLFASFDAKATRRKVTISTTLKQVEVWAVEVQYLAVVYGYSEKELDPTKTFKGRFSSKKRNTMQHSYTKLLVRLAHETGGKFFPGLEGEELLLAWISGADKAELGNEANRSEEVSIELEVGEAVTLVEALNYQVFDAVATLSDLPGGIEKRKQIVIAEMGIRQRADIATQLRNQQIPMDGFRLGDLQKDVNMLDSLL